MNKRIIPFYLLISTVFYSGCSRVSSDTSSQTNVTKYDTYKGDLNVVCDAGLEPIIKQQVEIFSYLYDSIHLKIAYKDEKDVIDDFRLKNTNLVILSRALEQSEVSSLKENDTIYTREMPLAFDAVALITNKNFSDSSISLPILKSYFEASADSLNGIRLIFDSESSSAVKFVMKNLGYSEKVHKNVFALKTIDDVINYVSQSKNAIGFIPYNRISDTDNPSIKELLKRIKVLSLALNGRKGERLYVSANQSDIAVGDYPLTRTITAVTRYTYTDNLELLFMGFLTREKGAKIFLKAGLIPVKMPEREIIVNETGLKAKR